MADVPDNFEVVAGWTNVGSADLFLSCNVCVWFYEWTTSGIDGRAPLSEIVKAAGQHWGEVHGAQLPPVPDAETLESVAAARVNDHPFQPYRWEPNRCGYVNGDDEMCGAALFEHRSDAGLPPPAQRPEERSEEATIHFQDDSGPTDG